MPNCQWFGTRADHASLLDTIFAMDEVDVYDLQSPDGVALRRHADTAAALPPVDTPEDGGQTLHLSLWVRAAADAPNIIRVTRPRADGQPATWFDRASADGFVHLYLGLTNAETLASSTTNTPSPARMGAVDGIVTGPRGRLDVGATHRWSAKLNRNIAKRSVARLGAFLVLPGAADLWHRGGAMDRMTPATHSGVFRTNS